MVLYKIVTPTRRSFIAGGKYSLYYPVGKYVEAVRGTLGIMCFNSERHAKMFSGDDIKHYLMIKLEPLSEVFISVKIQLGANESDLDHFYAKSCEHQYFSGYHPPSGTVTCMRVRVLT